MLCYWIGPYDSTFLFGEISMVKARRKRLEKVSWKNISTSDSNGCMVWESRDGMIRLRRSDRCEGIVLPTLWQIWAYTWHWRKVYEGRSRKNAERYAAEFQQKLNDET